MSSAFSATRWKANSSFVLNKRYTPAFLLVIAALVSTALHFRIFTTDIVGPHAWRQTFTQSNIDCFYEEDNNITHLRRLARGNSDEIKYQEFPLMQWSIAQVYRVTTQEITVTRTCCFLIGIAAWLGFYFLLCQLTPDWRTRTAGAAMFLFSPLFYYYMINPLPDLLALACATWSMALYYYAWRKEKHNWYFAATLILCGAALSKLPFIVFAGVPLTIFGIHLREKKMKQGGWKLLFSSVLFIPAAWWYAKVLPSMLWNPVVSGVFSGTAVDHSSIIDILVGNAISSLPELFLNYLAVPFFLTGLVLLAAQKLFRQRTVIPFVVTGLLTLLYFFYEMNLISTVHDYYMLPFLPLLFLVAARGWKWIVDKNIRWMKIAAVLLVVFTPLTAYMRINPRWDTTDPGFPVDWLLHRDELRAAVPDDALVVMGSDVTQCIMPYYVHKRGWTYNENELTAEVLQKYINEGARYLYTNSEITLRDQSLRPFLEKEICAAGSVHVFELQH